MDTQLLIICALTFSINLIGALAYAARIARFPNGAPADWSPVTRLDSK